MKKILKWTAVVVGVLLVIGFVLFLYYIPPFTLAAPEAFIQPEANAGPPLDNITDGRLRLLAGRGKYLVTTAGCTGCHTANGSAGPDWQKYLAGGTSHIVIGAGTAVAFNLTPDAETGLGNYSDEEILAVFRSGQARDGRIIHDRMMPWATFSNWSEEDKHAVVAYLRQLKPVRHPIPPYSNEAVLPDSAAIEAILANDHAVQQVSGDR